MGFARMTKKLTRHCQGEKMKNIAHRGIDRWEIPGKSENRMDLVREELF
ncbi:hypothetical protein PM10SUCC1_31670 [Propionigenium maris DSM 9537]|uniref:Uncharacterized protein n=1 Tax=Propionigenium maris DSM 9537 TaxID=1123000 RepID=A0A9W6GM68_9FUSO|nr:hypothetical protein PM10SUCC1_31670 [Propionigenium maris DSM 9537]